MAGGSARVEGAETGHAAALSGATSRTHADMGIVPPVSRSMRAAKSIVGRKSPFKTRWKFALSYWTRRAISALGILAAAIQDLRRSCACMSRVV